MSLEAHPPAQSFESQPRDADALEAGTLVAGALDLDLRRPGLIGLVGAALLIGVFGLWTGLTVISSAVVAQGQTVVKGKPQVVQSLDGGVVKDILVGDGDIVEAGQTLLQLDPTLLAVNLDIARQRLAASLALQARLEAEYQSSETLHFSYPALPFPRPDTTADEAGQRAIFEARQIVRIGHREKLTEALAQIDNQIIGTHGQITAIDAQIGLLDAEIDTQNALVTEGLARHSQLSTLERSHAELAGRQAALRAELARLKNARQDARLSSQQEERSFLEEVVTELRAATAITQELILEITNRRAQLDEVDIRAPAAGIVHDMQVYTTGAVIAPGGTIGQVVPLENGMDFTLQVAPQEIDQVHVGQAADIVLTAFDRNTTPKLAAEVSAISAGAIPNAQTGQSYYRVILSVSAAELARIDADILKPGMPVEAFLKTGERTVISYLLEPLSGHIRRAFLEG